MSFRLVPKSMTSNELEWCNGLYFALFHRIGSSCGTLRKSGRTCRRKKFTFTISSPDEFLVKLLIIHFRADLRLYTTGSIAR